MRDLRPCHYTFPRGPNYDGIVLLSRGNHQVMLLYGLCPGFDWSEKTMGTNGAGTALVTDSAVAVIGLTTINYHFEKRPVWLCQSIHQVVT